MTRRCNRQPEIARCQSPRWRTVVPVRGHQGLVEESQFGGSRERRDHVVVPGEQTSRSMPGRAVVKTVATCSAADSAWPR